MQIAGPDHPHKRTVTPNCLDSAPLSSFTPSVTNCVDGGRMVQSEMHPVGVGYPGYRKMIHQAMNQRTEHQLFASTIAPQYSKFHRSLPKLGPQKQHNQYESVHITLLTWA
eukprot:3926589-Rhodomonas_salina.2